MKAKTITNEQGTHRNVLGDQVRVILRSEETGGSLTLVQRRSAPGAGVPLHLNTREDEVFQVLEGEVEFQVEERTLTAAAGTVVYAPRHMPDGFRASGERAALIQITMVPGGLERMIEEVLPMPMPPDREQIVAICGKHGVQFLSGEVH